MIDDDDEEEPQRRHNYGRLETMIGLVKQELKPPAKREDLDMRILNL